MIDAIEIPTIHDILLKKQILREIRGASFTPLAYNFLLYCVDGMQHTTWRWFSVGSFSH